MAKNITLRLAWHQNDWNGHICKNPKLNTFCIGNHSYPGDLIKKNRDLEWEMQPEVCGRECSGLDKSPACALSINAFGKQHLKALSTPPVWFNDNSKGVEINIPPSTACIWPYEEMYTDDVLRSENESQKYDYDKRLTKAKDYFAQLEKNKSLVIYYANYSNPFSEDESKKYVIVGISRLKEVGKINYYTDVSEENKKKYAGGFVWQMPITSNYPDEGFKIPYSKYIDNHEVLDKILCIPESSRNFKYATREIDDDDLLSIIEKLLEIVDYLIAIGDDTEDWIIRKKWLISLLEETWKDRGAYPGILSVLNLLQFEDGIDYYKSKKSIDEEKEAFFEIKKIVKGELASLSEKIIDEKKIKNLQRNYKLLSFDKQKFLLEIAPRINFTTSQLKNILAEDRSNNSIYSNIDDIKSNPYIISESYIGDDIDDIISFSKIDHGVLPSPELGLEPVLEKNSPERFRALCINQLKYHSIHTFVPAKEVIENINVWLSSLSDWKKEIFTENYFEADREFLEQAIKLRYDNDNKLFLYLKSVYEDERLIEKTLKDFVQREDIKLKKVINEQKFIDILEDKDSSLFRNAENQYKEALKGQAKVCQNIFTKPLAVIAGSAGTGKTTLIKAIIKNIVVNDTDNSSIFLLAPTGKASERIKEKTGFKTASTIHSFLANRGWLNSNLTIKKVGGKVEDKISTLIIDECSMIDLELLAALFKSINWNSISRLILVGDPYQLPPIGRGKVFAEIIEWLQKDYPENYGKLEINVRQLENKILAKGNGILDLASQFLITNNENSNHGEVERDKIISLLQEGGRIDSDLEIVYWNDEIDLEAKIKEKIIDDLERETNQKYNEDRPYELWQAACNKDNSNFNTSYQQVISPFRGEYYGVENLNILFQKLYNKKSAERITNDGIALFDKVIQIRNRPKSNSLTAYNIETKSSENVEIYNGELGIVKAHGFDGKVVRTPYYRMDRFQVVFKYKEKYWVNYGKNLGKNSKTSRWITSEEPLENLELGYVISVHKAQGSDFDNVYLVLPKRNHSILSMELMYTAITRAKSKLIIFAQSDVTTFLSLLRPENSNLRKINSSLMKFEPLPEKMLSFSTWYEEGKIISTLSKYFVRSKSEMNIANILSLKEIPFEYEMPLFAKDGSMFLPDFTIKYKGRTFYWEHVGRLDLPKYKEHWKAKEKWYNENFPNQLIITYETEMQSKEIEKIIQQHFN